MVRRSPRLSVRARVLVCAPRAVFEPDPLRASALLCQQPLRLLERRRLDLGEPTLGEIPQAMTAAPADDGDLPAPFEQLEHHADIAAAVPPVRLPRAHGVVDEL